MAPPHDGNAAPLAHVETASGGNGYSSPAMFPLHHCKVLHLVRHAEARHNVPNAKDADYFDAALTPGGWDQVDNLQKHVQASGLSKKIELVVISPHLRTLQTAVGVFGGRNQEYERSVPLMVANAGNCNRPGISSNCVPHFLAVEDCREHLGVWISSKRRSVSEYSKLFPAVDFSLMENDEDSFWKAEKMELKEEMAERGMKFLEWFANCELRSLVLVDRSVIHSNASATDHNGSTPGDC